MTLEEFSNGFDTLVSSYRRFRDFDKREPMDTIEFDEYEKSFYLTKAQEEIVLSLYNGRNSSNLSLEETEEMRRYLSPLIEEAELNPITTSSGMPLGVDSKSKFFTLPDDLWFITYEAAGISDGKCGEGTQDVVPVRQDEYHKVKRNPFRGSNGRRALRLDLSDNNIEIVSKNTVTKYYVRYLKRIRPIIIEQLPNDLTIENEHGASTCEVHEGLHQKILERAVELALWSKGVGIQSQQNRRDNKD